MNPTPITITIQTAHRVILGHEQVMPIERCERDCVPAAEIVEGQAPDSCRDCRDEIVGLRADLIRATEALVAVGEECEQLRHIRLLADNLAADIKGARNTVQSWAELQEALDVLRGAAQ